MEVRQGGVILQASSLKNITNFCFGQDSWNFNLSMLYGLHGFLRQMEHFLTEMSNRVEHQKLNQVTAELPPGWVFGVQLGLRQTHALINTYHIILIHHRCHFIHHLSIPWKLIQLAASWITFQYIDRWWMTWRWWCKSIMWGINQCLCLPKTELNTINSTKRSHIRFSTSDRTLLFK